MRCCGYSRRLGLFIASAQERESARVRVKQVQSIRCFMQIFCSPQSQYLFVQLPGVNAARDGHKKMLLYLVGGGY